VFFAEYATADFQHLTDELRIPLRPSQIVHAGECVGMLFAKVLPAEFCGPLQLHHGGAQVIVENKSEIRLPNGLAKGGLDQRLVGEVSVDLPGGPVQHRGEL
jgi:hypothetical protein